VIPDFEISYDPDYRQNIASTWPTSINDGLARKDWGWVPDYDLDAMTRDMLEKLDKKLHQLQVDDDKKK
jgi:nucleoside-diphosphate-sugar epimerase